MVSMKLSKASREATQPTKGDAPDAPAYPYGLQLQLDDATIEKLGIKMPKVGGALLLEARVEVTAVSSHDSKDGGKNRNVSLQITEMCLSRNTSSKAEAAAALYGS